MKFWINVTTDDGELLDRYMVQAETDGPKDRFAGRAELVDLATDDMLHEIMKAVKRATKPKEA